MEEKALERHIFMRNLRNGGLWAVRTQGMLVLITGAYGFMMGIMMRQSDESWLDMIWSYVVMLELLGMLVFQIEYAGKNLLLALSFGSGRLESVWGMQIANLVFFVQSVLIFCILPLVTGAIDSTGLSRSVGTAQVILLFTVFLLAAAALGQCGVALFIRNGGKRDAVTVIFIIVAALLTVGFGVVFYVSVFSGEMGSFSMPAGFVKAAGGFAGIAGVILYVVGFVAIKKYIARYEVR